MTRSVWKGPFIDTSLLKSTLIRRRVWSRRSCILPQFVGSYTSVYNGKSFIGLKITEDMVGHKFGEFASTRKPQLKRKIVRLRDTRKKSSPKGATSGR